jgi:iron complex outermembrane recepter protein
VDLWHNRCNFQKIEITVSEILEGPTMKMRCATALAITALLFSVVGSAPAVAQQADTSAQPAPDDGSQLQTVIVSAQRRSERINDVPYSISALGGQQLQDDHISNIEDITRSTPGVSFGADANPGMDTVTIRGVSSQGGGATVGLYLDDVPITTTNPFNPSYSGATQPVLFDVDRVEILRGPQGTLYGSGSMGGTIRYIYNQPNLATTSVTTNADVSGTDRGSANTEDSAVLNVALVPDVAAVRAAVYYTYQSGYIDRYTFIPPTQSSLDAGGGDSHAGALDGTGVNASRTFAGRLSFTYAPSDRLKIELAAMVQDYGSDDTSLFYPSVGLFAQDKLVPEPSSDKMYVPSLTISGNLGWADLTSVSGYFRRDNSHHSDGTFFNSDFIEYLADFYYPDTIPCNCGAAFAAEPGPSQTEQVTQTSSEELRLASKLPAESGIPLSWIVGLYLSDHRIDISDNEYVTGLRQTFINLYGIDPANSGFADPFLNDSVFWAVAHEVEQQFAGFGEASYFATPDLKLTLGLRTMTARTDYLYDEGGYFAQGIPPVVSLNNDYHATTPKVSVDYKLSDDLNLYATAAKGYRLGGYIQPIQTTVGLCVADLQALGLKNPGFSYGSDSLWSYEAGAKSELLDNRLSVNAAAYYIDWKNVQQTFDLSCGSPYTANFGSAVSYGGELEVRAKPAPGLTLGFDAGTTHATLTQVQPDVGASVGQRLLNTPSWTAAVNGEYAWFPAPQWRAFVRSEYAWVGPSHGTYDVTAVNYDNPSYGLLKGSIGLDAGRYELSVYADNLLNNHTIIQHVSIEETVSAYAPQPLTVGLHFTASFQ